MRTIDVKNTYKQDLKRVIKQGWDGSKINNVISQLLSDDILDPALRDHPLTGDYKDFRECHVKSDLVVVYKRTAEILSLYRIGRHQDIFKGY
ncbi:type II toxin-antitoxin system YafQ family toxin [Helicobacter magdeburgensis]|uniref:Type II toxin-antitoxin system YafQ family toxin n=1 Tax=Helicobacter magdeburgensis TaxID=471858 RepID=A0A4U8SWS4_9HELI|nr:type II toxin-antitoxin system YafQ family toxin [Helicobacter magdeburgensis]TLD91385.1 type II toxin-antitoxin system YafQ family toxin [Helicobacter magdeburgensis]